MTERFEIVSNYIGAVGLLTQLLIIALQVRLYRSTRHKSAAVLATSTALGICFLALAYTPRYFGLSVEARLSLDIAAAVVETIQAVIGIAGVVLLFRAFERALAKAHAA